MRQFVQSSIRSYWNGKRHGLFDTSKDSEYGQDNIFTAENLRSELAKGYSFVHVVTHGSQTQWLMQDKKFYDNSYAESQCNYGHTILTTFACLSNAFDYYSDPCLSESLIRNQNDKIVAFFGSSRESWGSTSLAYFKEFYKVLFSSDLLTKNFSKVVSMSKMNLTPYVTKHKFDSFRWQQFSFNPIGDPEMPVFISKPSSFQNVNIAVDESGIMLRTGIENCRIAITDQLYLSGAKLISVSDNTDSIHLNGIPSLFNVCVTKQNYISYCKRIYYSHDRKINNKLLVNSDIAQFGPNSSEENGVELGDNADVSISAAEIIFHSNFKASQESILNIKF